MEEQFLEIREADAVARHRLASAPASPGWDISELPEPRVHRIHAYPAKFPAFLTGKALAYGRRHGVRAQRVADVFCGCGTVAYEARRAGLDFWGCDINPVATLIARTKGGNYRPARLRSYCDAIMEAMASAPATVNLAPSAVARLEYWFALDQFKDLARLLNAIDAVVPSRSHYRTAFHCAFSAILKGCSRWRQRSIKPTLDPRKQSANVLTAFESQCALMAKAFEAPRPCSASESVIRLANVLTVPPPEPVDLIVTSPPYVTSYEYADLHQLSSLWLGYASDHRNLRAGSIGSSQHDLNFKRVAKRLNRVGTQVVFSLYNYDRDAARDVANYYVDMQAVAARCRQFLTPKGIAVFVIGNTRYRGVDIDNASHLAESLIDAGFRKVRATRRRISNKCATPYRDDTGRYSRSRTQTQIYAEEFVLIAHL